MDHRTKRNPNPATPLYKRASRIVLLAGVVLALGGCATFGAVEPRRVSVTDVERMVKNGVPTATILKKMHDSGTVYRLSAAQLAGLHDQGVPDRILNYMQGTYLEAVRNNQALRDENNWEMGEDGYLYSWGHYPWMWGPFSRRGDFR